MKKGYLVWNGGIGRADIKFDDGGYYGGLHCGNMLEALIDEKWISARIECRRTDDDDIWFLIDENDKSHDEILHMTVRI